MKRPRDNKQKILEDTYQLLCEGKLTREIHRIIYERYNIKERAVDNYIAEAKVIQAEVFAKYTEEYICKQMEELLAKQIEAKNFKEARLLLESINKIKNGTKSTTDINISYKADFE